MPSVVIGLALLAFWLYCLFDVITTPEEDIRNLPKVLWVIVVVFVAIAGGVLWLLAGRPKADVPPGASGRPGGRRRPAGPGPQGDRPAPPKGPDDDPDFLRGLERRLRDED